jgi:hypothetical protein
MVMLMKKTVTLSVIVLKATMKVMMEELSEMMYKVNTCRK